MCNIEFSFLIELNNDKIATKLDNAVFNLKRKLFQFIVAIIKFPL